MKGNGSCSMFTSKRIFRHTHVRTRTHVVRAQMNGSGDVRCATGWGHLVRLVKYEAVDAWRAGDREREREALHGHMVGNCAMNYWLG